jgi:hypothetical protein
MRTMNGDFLEHSIVVITVSKLPRALRYYTYVEADEISYKTRIYYLKVPSATLALTNCFKRS